MNNSTDNNAYDNNTSYQHTGTLATHPINTSYSSTLSTHLLTQPSLSTLPLNRLSPSTHALNPHSNPPSMHLTSTQLLTYPLHPPSNLPSQLNF